MTERPPSNESDLESDPDLIAALQAAFGDEGIESFAELDSEQDVDHENPEDSVGTLDQPMELLEQVSGLATSSILDTSTEGEDPRYVVFFAAGQIAAFPISGVTEIERLPDYTELPRTPSWCLGVANIRGKIVSVTDLAALAQAPLDSEPADPKVIVVHGEESGATTAVVVDQVMGIRSFCKGVSDSPDDLSVPLAPLADQIATTDHGPVLLVNPDRLFAHPEMQPLMKN